MAVSYNEPAILVVEVPEIEPKEATELPPRLLIRLRSCSRHIALQEAQPDIVDESAEARGANFAASPLSIAR